MLFCEFAGMTKLGLQSSMTDNGSPRRRLMGQEGLGMGPGGVGPSPMDQRLGQIRPQLRPQRSLDNRLAAGGQQQNPQDMLTNQLDQQQQNNAMFSTNNQMGGGTQQRVDNQGQMGMDGSQMNINTSSIGAGGMTVSSMSNQLNAMSGSLMSGMTGQQQQQPQQQSQQLGGHPQQQQNNQFVASSTSTSMGYQQQQPNQLTMANNNNSMQQPQQVQ